MEFNEWKKTVWPTLPEEHKAAIRKEVAALKAEGWGHKEAWVQAACTV